jgi:hypothetical protein
VVDLLTMYMIVVLRRLLHIRGVGFLPTGIIYAQDIQNSLVRSFKQRRRGDSSSKLASLYYKSCKY